MRRLPFVQALVSFAMTLALVSVADAQPNARQIQRDLRQAFPSSVEVRIRPDAARTRQVGPSQWEHQQMVEVVSPTSDFPGAPNAKSVSYGGAIFMSSNNRRWTYDRFTIGETTYEGVPTPSLDDLKQFFRSKRYEDFFQYERYIVGMPELAFNDTGCRWHSPTRLECTFNTTIDMQRGSSIARMPRSVTVTLWREEGQEAFNRFSTSWSDNGRPERIDPIPPEIAQRQKLTEILAAL